MGHTQYALMQRRRPNENDNGRHHFRHAVVAHRQEKVPKHPVVHRAVPLAPVGVEAAAVPPVLVELSVSEERQLGDDPQPQLEHAPEHEQPQRQRRDGRLEQARQNVWHVGLPERLGRVHDGRHQELLADYGHQRETEEELQQPLRDPDPADALRSRVPFSWW